MGGDSLRFVQRGSEFGSGKSNSPPGPVPCYLLPAHHDNIRNPCAKIVPSLGILIVFPIFQRFEIIPKVPKDAQTAKL